jgi:hypothetical protein
MKFLLLTLVCLMKTIISEDEEKYFQKLNKTTHEKDAIKILNELIYRNVKFTDFEGLHIMYKRNWIKASQLIFDFMLNMNVSDVKDERKNMIKYMRDHIDNLRSILDGKKKNIVKISPIFEWSQDNEEIKIRLKFAKNLESPGEKDIQKFQVNCTREYLLVQGYKTHEDYVAYYYRNLHLYDYILPYTCKAYKETDGTYIVKFTKNQATLYWNFLDQITGDHYNTYTWFDVFTAFDGKAKYTEFRDWAMDNLLNSDLSDHVRDQVEDKNNRIKKIQNVMNFFKSKTSESKNYCLSPIDTKYCNLPNINEWEYWMY